MAEREALPLKERVSRGLALDDLEIADTGAALGNRTLLWLTCSRPLGLDRFRSGPGQPVRLWRERPEEADAVRGVIARRRRDQLGVMIHGDVPESLDDTDALRLDKDDDQATFDRGDQAIQAFLDAPRQSGRAGVRAAAGLDAARRGPQRGAA